MISLVLAALCCLTFRQIAMSGYFVLSWMKEKLHGTSPIPSKLLSYVWTHWDHPVEVNKPVVYTYLTRLNSNHFVIYQMI